jgi:hypothetical protein
MLCCCAMVMEDVLRRVMQTDDAASIHLLRKQVCRDPRGRREGVILWLLSGWCCCACLESVGCLHCTTAGCRPTHAWRSIAITTTRPNRCTLGRFGARFGSKRYSHLGQATRPDRLPAQLDACISHHIQQHSICCHVLRRFEANDPVS